MCSLIHRCHRGSGHDNVHSPKLARVRSSHNSNRRAIDNFVPLTHEFVTSKSLKSYKGELFVFQVVPCICAIKSGSSLYLLYQCQVVPCICGINVE